MATPELDKWLAERKATLDRGTDERVAAIEAERELITLMGLDNVDSLEELNVRLSPFGLSVLEVNEEPMGMLSRKPFYRARIENLQWIAANEYQAYYEQGRHFEGFGDSPVDAARSASAQAFMWSNEVGPEA